MFAKIDTNTWHTLRDTNIGRCWGRSVCWSTLANSDEHLANFDHVWPSFADLGQNQQKQFPTGQSSVERCHVLVKFGQNRPISAKIWPKSAKFGRIWAEARLPEAPILLIWANIGGCRGTLGQSGSECDQCWPNSAELWQNKSEAAICAGSTTSQSDAYV